MSDIYVAISETRFVDYNIGGRHVLAPHFVAEKHLRSSWEVPRFDSMERYLKPGMCLFDIGAEQGGISAIYSRFVGGGSNIVLFEPCPQAWPNIKATWHANQLETPRGVYCGFVSAESRVSDFHDFLTGYRDGWPECAYGEYLLDATKFRYETEHPHCTDSITIDKFVADTGIVPSAITVDVEGFESLVIRGAIKTLTEHRPLCWISLHDKNNIFNQTTGRDSIQESRDLMNGIGYREEYLGTDHEIHTFWQPL